MNAMTFFDHKTFSIWSQPWGTAIMGPLKGTTIDLIPATVVPWGTWLNDHPDTLALLFEPYDDAFYSDQPRQFSDDRFVVGALIGQEAKGYWLPTLLEERVVNDEIGPFSVLAYGDPETSTFNLYLRTIGEHLLTFKLKNGKLVDNETGSVWDPILGLAKEGELKGIKLQAVPTLTAFDWAWWDFYPNTEIYGYVDTNVENSVERAPEPLG